MSDTPPQMRQDRDLVLPPHTYAYVLDSTKGKVSAYVGPYKNSLSNTDQLVVWDDQDKRVRVTQDVERAIVTFTTAEEGQYVVLTNPVPAASSSAHPPTGNSSEAVDLDFGRRVIIPGPVSFPLWPGQTAQAINGHHLRHNEYLVIRVYDEDQARANWESAVLAPQTATATAPVDTPEEETSTDRVEHLTMGQLHIIRGTDVSFYMPSTGVEVVPDDSDSFVRSAVTLETLEYCLLLDENGQKRYVRGPAVVFPSPTEKFVESKHGTGERVFRAIELNENSGLYVKVVEAYTDDDDTEHPVGEEMFITGRQTAIYFPRSEHSIITYGDQKKHYAIAIPSGEGRYVLDRNTGQVDLVLGPKMFLPNPIHQVVVRRILADHDCEILYPGNAEALAVNTKYREESGRLSPGEHLANAEMSDAIVAVASASPGYGQDFMSSSTLSYAGAIAEPSSMVPASARSKGMRGGIQRSTAYQPPRMITLDTKYEGAVAINIWPGYAVLVTDRTGSRRVEIGPKVVQLAYDEMIMTMELSTGRPKSDRNLLKTGYLRVANNVVSDIVTVETRDLVSVDIEISYRVNFEADSPEDATRWFEVENYVQVLTDHCRSRLRNAAKRHDIRSFYTDTIDIVRDTLLGVSPAEGQREGLPFKENGMRVYDVEVLNVEIDDDDVARLLSDAQSSALSGAITLSIAEEKAARDAKLEELKRASLAEKAETDSVESSLRLESVNRKLDENLATASADLKVEAERAKIDEARLAMEKARFEQTVSFTALQNQVELDRLVAETTERVRASEALSPELITALTTVSHLGLAEKLIASLGPIAAATGVTTADMLKNTFEGTPLASIMSAMAERPLALTGNGSRNRETV